MANKPESGVMAAARRAAAKVATWSPSKRHAAERIAGTTGGRCAARRVGQDFACATCRLTWDVNDREPPPCPRVVRVAPPTRSTIPPVDVRAFVSGLPDRIR